MNFFKRATIAFFQIGENAGRIRALHELRNLNDDVLKDVGISRALLNQGVSAWPWRAAEAAGDARVVAIPQTAANTGTHDVRRAA